MFTQTCTLSWLKQYLISLSKFNLPLIGTFTWPMPPGPYRATTCQGRELNYVSHTYFFDNTRTWSVSPYEWSAQCRGHLRDSTNMKDDTHQAHTQSSQQGEYNNSLSSFFTLLQCIATSMKKKKNILTSISEHKIRTHYIIDCSREHS